MVKKITNAEALTLLADNALANTQAVKELTALLSEVTTKPENGKDGETPYIKNGNWWVGSQDMGVKAAIKMPITTLVVAYQAGLSKEDQAKVNAGTHSATNPEKYPLKAILPLGAEYKNKYFLAFLDNGEIKSGKLDVYGQLELGELKDKNKHQATIQIFEAPITTDYTFHLGVSENQKLLNKVTGFVYEAATRVPLIEGYDALGNRVTRQLEYGKDQVVIKNAESGALIFDSESSPRAEEIMRNRERFYPSQYLIIVTAKLQEGVELTETLSGGGLPSQL